MQSDEDYNQVSVKQRISEVFSQLMQEESFLRMERLKSLLGLAQAGKIDYRQLMFVNMMLPYITTEGRQVLEYNLDTLIYALKQQSQKSDCTWQKILYAFMFHDESKSIEKFLSISKLTEE